MNLTEAIAFLEALSSQPAATKADRITAGDLTFQIHADDRGENGAYFDVDASAAIAILVAAAMNSQVVAKP